MDKHHTADVMRERMARITDERERLLERKQHETDEELERLAREETRLSRVIAIVDEYGDDDWPVGTVFTFSKNFASSPGVRGSRTGSYTYVVLKAGDGDWYLSGAVHRDGMSWTSLVAFFASAPAVAPADVWVASEYTCFTEL